MRGLLLALALSLTAGTSASACGSLPPGTVLPPGMVPPRSSLPPGTVPPISTNPSQSDIALVRGLHAGTLAPADRQRAIELLMRELERELRSATLADADLERARELLQLVRTFFERGEMQPAIDLIGELARLSGQPEGVPLQCGSPPITVPPA